MILQVSGSLLLDININNHLLLFVRGTKENENICKISSGVLCIYIYNFTIMDYLWYFTDYYLQSGENSWIADRENENSSHRSVNNENKSHAMPAKTQLPDLSVNKLYLNCRPLVTLAPILHAFSTERLKFASIDFNNNRT